jgi:hypothetical protein
MKTIITLLCIALFAMNASATVRTVSNNANSPGQFTDMQAAIDASTNGDTIYVHGSPTTYGNIYLNRSLTVIGPGYNPKKDLPLTASMNALYLDSVAGIKGCSNSKVMGITTTYLYNKSGAFIRIHFEPERNRSFVCNHQH